MRFDKPKWQAWELQHLRHQRRLLHRRSTQYLRLQQAHDQVQRQLQRRAVKQRNKAKQVEMRKGEEEGRKNLPLFLCLPHDFLQQQEQELEEVVVDWRKPWKANGKKSRWKEEEERTKRQEMQKNLRRREEETDNYEKWPVSTLLLRSRLCLSSVLFLSHLFSLYQHICSLFWLQFMEVRYWFSSDISLPIRFKINTLDGLYLHLPTTEDVLLGTPTQFALFLFLVPFLLFLSCSSWLSWFSHLCRCTLPSSALFSSCWWSAFVLLLLSFVGIVSYMWAVSSSLRVVLLVFLFLWPINLSLPTLGGLVLAFLVRVMYSLAVSCDEKVERVGVFVCAIPRFATYIPSGFHHLGHAISGCWSWCKACGRELSFIVHEARVGSEGPRWLKEGLGMIRISFLFLRFLPACLIEHSSYSGSPFLLHWFSLFPSDSTFVVLPCLLQNIALRPSEALCLAGYASGWQSTIDDATQSNQEDSDRRTGEGLPWASACVLSVDFCFNPFPSLCDLMVGLAQVRPASSASFEMAGQTLVSSHREAEPRGENERWWSVLAHWTGTLWTSHCLRPKGTLRLKAQRQAETRRILWGKKTSRSHKHSFLWWKEMETLSKEQKRCVCLSSGRERLARSSVPEWKQNWKCFLIALRYWRCRSLILSLAFLLPPTVFVLSAICFFCAGLSLSHCIFCLHNQWSFWQCFGQTSRPGKRPSHDFVWPRGFAWKSHWHESEHARSFAFPQRCSSQRTQTQTQRKATDRGLLVACSYFDFISSGCGSFWVF